MIIAFMGNDGSGKTTLAKEFKKRLDALGLKVKYRAEFNYFLISFIFRLFGREHLKSVKKKNYF